ncbi:lytic murein transglycosylase [Tropicimonas marinistellae]|uniref:lytic murein transglycosylase n=1 Tax=Tropicimonas marinistellae TaxID=1739787 RepID=UPI00082D0E99|nr:lytic murein transglycosylase [Tropicimonas marinistellae]
MKGKVSLLAAALAVATPAHSTAGLGAVDTSIRPEARPILAAALLPEERVSNIGFEDWISAFRIRAARHGISPATLDRAFAGVRYNTDVIQRDRNQSEFTKTIWDYLDTAASDLRVTNGQVALRENAALLNQIEDTYRVPAEIITAIWGLESAYGTFRGSENVIEAVATLAYDGRRAAFFEGELVAALQILESGDVGPNAMTGSWAGAMGHTQFMPSSFLAHAVDHDGNGKRDIWSDDPTDALASTAKYLADAGWIDGQPWGMEVILPTDFDVSLTGHSVKKSPADWAALGVRDTYGHPVPDHGEASVILPAGAGGVAFIIFQNFKVLERYNPADAYVLAVGHLGDRIRGGPAINGNWPRELRALLLAERIELQERLTSAGYDTQGVDGKIGPNTIAAIRGYQKSVGMQPDGYASTKVLAQLRQ